MDWLVLQLGDSAFPAGGFAHSAGLEAAAQLGQLRSSGAVQAFARDALWQAGYGALPAVGEAHREPARVAAIDTALDAFLTGAVANRASRTQGRALVTACAAAFDEPAVAALLGDVRDRRVQGHHAPLFGAVASALRVAHGDTLGLWMHGALRGVLSAAVRLGLLGAHEAQGTQRTLAPLLDQVVRECGDLGCDGLAQTSPRIEITGSQHDRLYSRLFQS